MRLPRVTAKEVERVLVRRGFSYSHAKGSHRSYVKADKRVIVPFHPGRIIPPGTLKNILKQAGISVEEFKGYL
ncbi:MAG: type II toxin-antitoxin system HicA family toxin [Candidatus Brocadiales bacterium]|nr:type II toxin-antitoxin system HicA family toxin [Candidatus Brocadiales bacterium]